VRRDVAAAGTVTVETGTDIGAIAEAGAAVGAIIVHAAAAATTRGDAECYK
jgi:hypothetical protein